MTGSKDGVGLGEGPAAVVGVTLFGKTAPGDFGAFDVVCCPSSLRRSVQSFYGIITVLYAVTHSKHYLR